MNTNDLYLEYARVIQMCKGTELDDTPWVCVRNNVTKKNYIQPPSYYDFLSANQEFAVAVLEGKPVFVGDRLWLKDGHQFAVEDDLHIDHKIMSWTPPTPKRTFTLNGVELPCPVGYSSVEKRYSFEIEGSIFYFDSIKNRNIVSDHVKNLLTEARDK